jgi:response regulator RpfG family c-di-GMP phosphodiesterase
MTRSPTALADQLFADGLISKDKYRGALNHFKQYGESIVESLLETGAIEEDTLLKQMAQFYKTRFVTTAKLKKAEIGQDVLGCIPGEVALKHMIFPILLDKERSILSIVARDPTNIDVEQEVTRLARVSKVQSYVARPAAIKAAINKFYRGDIHAFAALDKESLQAYQSMMDVYERNLLDEGAMAAAVATTVTHGERTLSEDEMALHSARAAADTDGGTAAGGPGVLSLEVIRVLVSLLESAREDLSGHSVLTARHTERVSKRIGISQHERDATTLAALLHDLGKGSPYHLTAFNVSEWDGHRVTAEKRYEAPLRILESASLPVPTITALKHMYERVDGKGFPGGLKGADIPLSARILALADTFADLTYNPRNPFRRVLETNEAVEVLRKAADTVFDRNMVELFATVVAGDDIKRQLLTGAQTLLVVDSDPESCAILEMQLTSHGFKVRPAHTADAAVRSMLEDPPDLVLTEVELEPFDGFELKRRLNEDGRTENIPLVYFTARAAAADVEKGFALGAQDYLVKPSTIDVVAAKLQKYLAQTAPSAAKGGVSGSLKEMSIPDLVQILSHGRKTGKLSLSSGKHRGEVHFVSGEIYNAMFGDLRGEDAFFAMLRFRDGSFAIDPDFTADDRVIQMTAEMLLLEGLRRFDEDNR